MAKIVLDGKEFSGTFDQGVQKAKYVWRTKEGDKKDTVFGFTNQEAMKQWAKNAGLLELCMKGIDGEKRMNEWLKRPPTAEYEKSLEEWQKAQVNLKTKRLLEILERKGLKTYEIEKLDKLTKQDPLFGPIGSAFLYDKTWYGFPCIYLPSGWYPKLGWFGFNDRTESVYDFPIGSLVILYQHTWWRGSQLWAYYPLPNLGWFNNRASSAAIYG